MKLVYFTFNYPYGLGLEWKTNELNIFKSHFESVTVVPFFSTDLSKGADEISGINYELPLFRESLLDSCALAKLSKILFSPFLSLFLKEAIKNKVYQSFPKFEYWVLESYKIALILKNKKFVDFINKNNNSDTIFYSYWGRETILSFICLTIKGKIVCRFHGYDLYPERNKANYLPYQAELLKKIDLVLPCSDHGKSRLLELVRPLNLNIYTAYIGTISQGKTPKDNTGGVFSIVSCSSLIPLKRVNLIAEAIRFADFKIHWTHIGDGVEMQNLRKSVIACSTNPNVTINLVGKMKAKDIPCFYSTEHFDLFLNVSIYEGIPVSIMEALGAGIPILAPRVNGIPEIIDDKVGFLFDNDDFNAEKLWKLIDNISKINKSDFLKLSKNSYQRYLEKCDAIKNANKLVEVLNANFLIS